MNLVQLQVDRRPVVPAPNSRRAAQADETRERLLAVAWELVREQGIAALTIRQLAHRAHVSVGLPHAHFGSRDALLDLLRIRGWDCIDAIVREAGPAPRSAQELEAWLRQRLHAVVAFALQEPRLFELVSHTPGAAISERVFAREFQTAERFIEALTAAEREGVLRFEGDVVVFALALWTSVQGHVSRMSAKTQPGVKEVQRRVLDEVFDTFFARVRVAPARTQACA